MDRHHFGLHPAHWSLRHHTLPAWSRICISVDTHACIRPSRRKAIGSLASPTNDIYGHRCKDRGHRSPFLGATIELFLVAVLLPYNQLPRRDIITACRPPNRSHHLLADHSRLTITVDQGTLLIAPWWPLHLRSCHNHSMVFSYRCYWLAQH
jgi:hypothetical protein